MVCHRQTGCKSAQDGSISAGECARMAGMERFPSEPPSPRPPGSRATLSDVAREAGVSRWVAGRVLNGGRGNTRVGAAAADRIREVARKLNYRPNQAALQLRGRRSRTFGLLVGSAGDPLRAFLVQFLDAEAVRAGCHTLIGNTMGNPAVGPDQYDRYVEEFARRSVDGVFCAMHRWLGGDRQRLLERHPNTIFYEDPGLPGAAYQPVEEGDRHLTPGVLSRGFHLSVRSQSPFSTAAYVTVDREEAVRLAVRHVAGQGRRRIGLAVMGLSRPTHVARRRGYEAELASHGLPIDEQLIFNGETLRLAYPTCNEATARWEFPLHVVDAAIEALVDRGRVDAIVAHDDFWAAAMIKRLRGRGVRVPDDVAVVGYLNHYLADWTDPALTTIDLRHATAARCMVQMMERMIADGPLPEEQRVVTIQPKLIVRESA